MSSICINCGAVVTGNFCSNCGQPAGVEAISASSVVRDLQHGLLHVNGGMLHSARELFTRPGYSIREYIEGKRMKHYKPVSMLILLAGFYSLFYHALDINVFRGLHDDLLNYDNANEWIAHHFSIISLLLLPVLSLSSFAVFRRQGYNFTEHIILNSFYSCQKLWLRILTIPLLLWQESAMAVLQALMLADFLLMLWCYTQFFKNISMLKAVLATFLAYLIDLFLMLVLLTVVLMAVLAE